MANSLDFFNDQDHRIFSLKLFKDQKETYLKIKEAKDRGVKHMVVSAPTAFGKTALAAYLCHKMASQGMKVCFMSYQVILVYQTRNKFVEYGMNDPGVIWARALPEDVDYERSVQVASIRTLKNLSPEELDKFDAFIWDECHNREEFFLNYMKDNKDKLVLGLSASPFSDFLGDFFDELVLGPSMKYLMDIGRLSTYKLYAPECPQEIKSVKGKDYTDKAAEAAMQGIIQGDIVKHWFELAHNLPTIAFCSSRGNSGDLVKSFRAAGVTAEHIDCFTPDIEREDIIRKFKQGIIKVICNVGVLTAGFDADVRCLINAAPTKNMKIWVQRFGRALRTAKGKDHAIVLDFTGTYDHLGRPEDYVFTELNSGGKEQKNRDYGENIEEKQPKKDKTCNKCKFIYPKEMRSCPECGHKPLYSEDIDADYTANLAEIEKGTNLRKKAKPKIDKNDPVWRENLYSELLSWMEQRRLTGNKPIKGNEADVMYKNIVKEWRPRNIPKPEPKEPSPETLGLIRHSMIAYRHRQNKQHKIKV